GAARASGTHRRDGDILGPGADVEPDLVARGDVAGRGDHDAGRAGGRRGGEPVLYARGADRGHPRCFERAASADGHLLTNLEPRRVRDGHVGRAGRNGDRTVGQRLPQRRADVPWADDGRVVAVARRVQRDFAGVLVELVGRDIAGPGLPARQRGDVRGGQRVVVDLEVVHGGRQERVGTELRPADPVLVGDTQSGGVEGHAGVGRHRLAVHVQRPGGAGQGHGHVRPRVQREGTGVVELLLGTVSGGGGREAERTAAGAERQEHVVACAGAEVEHARPGGVGGRVDPRGDRVVVQPADDAARQAHVLAVSGQLDGVADLARYPQPGRAGVGDAGDRAGLRGGTGADLDLLAGREAGGVTQVEGGVARAGWGRQARVGEAEQVEAVSRELGTGRYGHGRED